MIKFIYSILIIGMISLFIQSCNDEGEVKNTKEIELVDKSSLYNLNILVDSWLDISQSKLNFTINQDGTARSDNMSTLLYKNWRINDDKLIFTIESVGNGNRSTSDYAYIIMQLDNNNLMLKSLADSTITHFMKHPSINITSNQKISSPLEIRLNSQAIWYASEGEIGTVTIVDDKNNILNLKNDFGILFTEDGDWMHSDPAFFTTKVHFKHEGLKNGKIIINNNLGEGEGKETGPSYSFEIPIVF